MLGYLIDTLTLAGVNEICFVVHYLAEQIIQHVCTGHEWKIQPTFIHQSAMLGTAHAVQQAQAFLTEPCFIIAADYFLPSNALLDFKRAYLEAGSDMGVVTRRVPAGEQSQRSSLQFNTKGQITAIIEKPAPGTAPSPYGANLIYIVPSTIRSYLQTLSLSPRQEYEFPTIINQMLANGHTLTPHHQPPPREWTPASG